MFWLLLVCRIKWLYLDILKTQHGIYNTWTHGRIVIYRMWAILSDCLSAIPNCFGRLIRSLIRSYFIQSLLRYFAITGSFVRSFIRWFARSLVRWLVRSLVRWFLGSFVGSLVRWFVGSLVLSFVRWFVGSLVRWFVRSLGRSFVRSLGSSFGCLFARSVSSFVR